MFRFTFSVCLLLVLLSRQTIGLAQETTSDITYVLDLAWSPDGTRLAFVGVHPGFLPAPDGSIQNPGWSPERNTYGYLNVIDGLDGSTIFKIQPSSAFTSVAWSPDGQRLALSSFDGTVWIVDALNGEHITNLFGHEATVTDVDWNSAGTRIVSSGNWDERLILWDANTYSLLSRFNTFGFPATVEFSSNDDSIVVGTDSGVFLFPSTIATNSTIDRNFEIVSDWIGVIDHSNDGRYVASGTVAIPSFSTGVRPNAYINIVDLSTGTTLHRFESSLGSIRGLSWSFDNRYVAVLNEDNLMTLWDIQARAIIATYPSLGTDRYNGGVAYSQYGGRLAFSNWLNPSQAQLTSSEDITVFAEGAIQIIVPNPSIERLNEIAALCDAPTIVDQAIPRDVQTETFNSFVVSIRELPDGTIPPACAADLIAVAEALAE